MRKTLFSIALLGMVSLGAWAACSPGVVVGNALGWQQPISGTPGTDIYCKFWEVGNSAAANSGTLASATMITAYVPGFYVTSNWGDGGVVGCPTGCPGACASNRTAFIYSILNGGAPQFIYMSTVFNGVQGYWFFDDITNGDGGAPNYCSPVLIPAVVVDDVTTAYVADLSWTPVANLRGFYDVDPGVDMITGYGLYYTTVPSGGSPADQIAGNWTLIGQYAATSTGVTGLDLSGVAPAGSDEMFLALSVLFNGEAAGGFRETYYVGTPSGSIAGPTASGVFSGFNAAGQGGQITAQWNSDVETNVANYQVYWSLTQDAANYRTGSSPIAPTGDGSHYDVTFTVPVTRASNVAYVKVRATFMDGTDEWSNVAKVTLSPFGTNRADM